MPEACLLISNVSFGRSVQYLKKLQEVEFYFV